MARLETIRRRPRRGRRAPPLLFVHGAYYAAWCWNEFFLPHFAARGFDCLALSLRGHGGSAGGDALDRAAIEDYAIDVAAAAAMLPSPPLVIGHSMGGVVAQRYAAAGGAAGLIVLNSVPPRGLMAESIELYWRNPNLLMQFGLVQSGLWPFADYARLREALFARDMSNDRAQRYFACMQRESQRALIELCYPQTIGWSLGASLPVAVVGGAEDGLFTPDSVRSTARWLGAQSAILPGLGHTMMLDCAWRRCADYIEQWIEEAILPADTAAIKVPPRRTTIPG